jgi:dihydropteroate synthase
VPYLLVSHWGLSIKDLNVIPSGVFEPRNSAASRAACVMNLSYFLRTLVLALHFPLFMNPRKIFKLKLPSRTLVLGDRTLIMGVLNVTPDSFSDGGKFFSVRDAVEGALAMQKAGADILDIGAESTRPGSVEIPAAEELSRLLPVLEALHGRLRIPISIDTQKSSVAEIAIGAGAEMLNDISGLNHDARIAEVAARHRVPLIVMHMRGNPRTMQKLPFAKDVVRDVVAGLRRSISKARSAGVAKSQIILDPGIGFGKSYPQNYELLANLPALAKLGYPLLIGTSRKGFLGATLARDGKRLPAGERIWGTAATVAASILNGAHIVRVHDVAEMAQVARVTDAILFAR